ncbi:MAG: hypothetical protein ACTIA6_12090 [Pseudoclavibacter sp.]
MTGNYETGGLEISAQVNSWGGVVSARDRPAFGARLEIVGGEI